MHESALIHSLLNIALKVKKENKLKCISKITITAGQMHQIIPEVMQESFDLMKKDFPGFEYAELVMNETPVKIRCRDCHQTITLSQPDFYCPHCHSSSTEVISGNELYIDSLEGE